MRHTNCVVEETTGLLIAIMFAFYLFKSAGGSVRLSEGKNPLAYHQVAEHIFNLRLQHNEI